MLVGVLLGVLLVGVLLGVLLVGVLLVGVLLVGVLLVDVLLSIVLVGMLMIVVTVVGLAKKERRIYESLTALYNHISSMNSQEKMPSQHCNVVGSLSGVRTIQ